MARHPFSLAFEKFELPALNFLRLYKLDLISSYNQKDLDLPAKTESIFKLNSLRKLNILA
jgi:hypothetical protein